MKKEYIAPEVLLRKVVLEEFIADSLPTGGGGNWDDMDAKDGGDVDSWVDKGNDIWED